jgi:hypothetical protein
MVSRFDALNRAFFCKPDIMPTGQAVRLVLFDHRNYKPQQMLSDIAGTAQEEDGMADEVAKDTADDNFTPRSPSEYDEDEDSNDGYGPALLRATEAELARILTAESFRQEMKQSFVDRAHKEGKDTSAVLQDSTQPSNINDGLASELSFHSVDLAADKDDEDAGPPATPHIERLHKQMASNGWLVLYPPSGSHGLQPQYIRADGSSPQPNCYQFCEAANDLNRSNESTQEPAHKPADEEHDTGIVFNKSNSEPETESLKLFGSAPPLTFPHTAPATVTRLTKHQSVWSSGSSDEAKECEETTSEEHKSSTNPSTPDKDAMKVLDTIGKDIDNLREAFNALIDDLAREEDEEKEKEAARAFEEHFAELQHEYNDKTQEDETQKAYVGDLDDLALVEADGDEKYLQERATLPWDGRPETQKLLPDGAWNRLAVSDGGPEPLFRSDKISPRFRRSLSPIPSIPPTPAPTPKTVIPVEKRSSWIY